MGKNYILLYDGVCGFCNSTIQLIIKHDKKKTMRFAAIQSAFAQQVFERHPILKEIDSLILIDQTDSLNEQIHIRSTGALFVAEYLGSGWNMFRIAWIIPPPLRDYAYDLFAKYRYSLFGKYDSCLLPPAEVRSRFID
ncbi:MAG: DCC1-like thiol-disulfide oxidoreductase family protein [Bacteroidota bacterium]